MSDAVSTNDTSSNPQIAESLIGEFRGRARRLYRAAFGFLLCMFVAILAAVAAVIFATDLTNRDYKQASASTKETLAQRLSAHRELHDAYMESFKKLKDKLSHLVETPGGLWFKREMGRWISMEAAYISPDGSHAWAIGSEKDRGILLDLNSRNETLVGDTGDRLSALHVSNDGKRQWIVGTHGVYDEPFVLASSDQGATWTTHELGPEYKRAWLSDVHFTIDCKKGWIVGHAVRTSNPTGQVPVVFSTVDGGATWSANVVTEEPGSLRSIYFSEDGQRGRIGGWRRDGHTDTPIIANTENGGTTWSIQNLGSEPGAILGTFFTSNGERGWAVGRIDIKTVSRPAVFATTDSGRNWTRQYVGEEQGNLVDVFFQQDGSRGWAVGNGRGNTIISTADGGRSWQTENLGLSHSLTNVNVTADGDGLLIGQHSLFHSHRLNVDINTANTVDDALNRLRGTEIAENPEGQLILGELEQLNQRVQPLEDAILDKSAILELSETKDGAPDTNFIWATNAMRVAIVAVLLFLVQILLTLYRYNMRLSAYYTARADALTMATADGFEKSRTSFGELVPVLSPDLLDYGKAPKTILELATDATRSLPKR